MKLPAIPLLWKLGATLALVGASFAYRSHVYQDGYQAGVAAAVAAGKEQYDRDVAAARKTESDLRANLAARDAAAFKKEKDHAASLEAAQRRVRAGIDSLRCPAGPVPAGAAAGDRPATGGPEADGAGPAIVPEVAAEILGDGAAVAGLVRRFERLEQRFDACRAVNAGP